MFILYDVLYLWGFVLYLPVLFARQKLHSGFKQRFAFFNERLKNDLAQKPNIWFHAVSVGEVLAIRGLVEKIRLKYPQHRIVVTTVTQTGYALAQKRLSSEDIVIFAPLDLRWVVRRFVKRIQPQIFVIAETEIWPNLLNALAQADVPIVLVNGRISDRSFYLYGKFRFLFSKALRSFSALCMQSVQDADRVTALGAVAKNVVVLGSMKFDDVFLAESLTRQSVSLKDDALVWVAGSTHPGEEKVVLDVFKKLKAQISSLSLVIAPRHIERAEEICDLIAGYGFEPIKFSTRSAQKTDTGAVMVVDTIGHLKSFYSLSDVVFVGKSLIGQGGQNIIEPAFFGKPIIVGPHMQNFADIMEIFVQARAVVQIQEPEELEKVVQKFLSSRELRDEMGERARQTVKKNQGATKAVADILSGILSTTRFYSPQ